MDLSVDYLGLKLKNPLIAGSSGLSSTFEKVKALEKAGVGAVVLKSLFEEQIMFEADETAAHNRYEYPEAVEYLKAYSQNSQLVQYLKLIERCKNEIKIPIIASINASTEGAWVSFAQKIEQAGADALELNVSLWPGNFDTTSEQNEQHYFNVIEQVSEKVKLPLALKMSNYSAGLAHLIKTLSWTKKVDAFVLFNRYYAPDIDIENLKMSHSNILNFVPDPAVTLRWVALLSGHIRIPISASTGIRSGNDVVKHLLAGAQTTQVVSVLYQNGLGDINQMLIDIEHWMQRKNYKKIDDFRGLLNYKQAENPEIFERIQFMKYLSSLE